MLFMRQRANLQRSALPVASYPFGIRNTTLLNTFPYPVLSGERRFQAFQPNSVQSLPQSPYMTARTI